MKSSSYIFESRKVMSFIDFIQEHFGETVDNFTGDEKMMKNYNASDYKFDTLGEFKIYLNSGAYLGFEYNEIEYNIEAEITERLA